MKQALLIVDWQYDFVDPKGSLYVSTAETKTKYILDLITKFKSEGNMIIASKDWHPSDHYSFEELWPVHCVQNTNGAKLMFDENLADKIILKGQNKDVESYSAFFDEDGKSNGLLELLEAKEIESIYLVGVATDVCVANTLNDAIDLNLNVQLDLNGCAGITNIIEF